MIKRLAAVLYTDQELHLSMISSKSWLLAGAGEFRASVEASEVSTVTDGGVPGELAESLVFLALTVFLVVAFFGAVL